jgi:hypothetical protein
MISQLDGNTGMYAGESLLAAQKTFISMPFSEE